MSGGWTVLLGFVGMLVLIAVVAGLRDRAARSSRRSEIEGQVARRQMEILAEREARIRVTPEIRTSVDEGDKALMTADEALDAAMERLSEVETPEALLLLGKAVIAHGRVTRLSLEDVGAAVSHLEYYV